MISCTEFIPAYSELFSFIEELSGRSGVDDFWTYLFEPTGEGIPLINHIKEEGIKGCFTYWKGSLNEEAADFTMYLNEKAGWFMLKMHHCPSKGRLLELKDELGITPYPDYCLHCDHYRSAVTKAGLEYLYNFEGVENASCSIIIYDPKIFDGRIIIDGNTIVMDRRSADNEYFHPEFHSSMNMGIDYLGEKFGGDAVCTYLERYTRNVYGKVISLIKEKGLPVLEETIKSTYEKEKSPDIVQTVIDKDTLYVKVISCPAVSYLKKSGRTVSKWYCYTTQTVMETMAKEAGYKFTLLSYDYETGAAEYKFMI